VENDGQAQQPATQGGAEEPVLAGDETAQDVRVRRERLRHELVELEEVLSGPVADAHAWAGQVRGAAASMHDTLRDHVEETEAPDGMLAQLTKDAPWLEGRIEQLRSEHARLLDAAERLEETCQHVEDPQRIRDVGLALLEQVSRHRQLGTDLLYDAYMVDISAAD
jgi:hypothetical protein